MRTGIDRHTGRVLAGWPHCAQSIAVILSTRLGSLVMARDFGGDGDGMLDRPSSAPAIMKLAMAAATALQRDEPAFRVVKIKVTALAQSGAAAFDVAGIFYPQGHLGDYSNPQGASTRAVLQ